MTRRLPNDDPLACLLRDFFVREMPPDLRALPDDAVDHLAVPSPAPGRRVRRPVLLGLLSTAGLVACGLLAAVMTELGEPPGLSEPQSASAPLGVDEPAGLSRRDNPAGSRDDAEPLLVIDGAAPRGGAPARPRRPVEEQNELNWATVQPIGEHADAPTDFAVPDDLAVEIVPQDAEPRLTPQPPNDPRLPEERGEDE